MIHLDVGVKITPFYSSAPNFEYQPCLGENKFGRTLRYSTPVLHVWRFRDNKK